jgi:hypothetical protein
MKNVKLLTVLLPVLSVSALLIAPAQAQADWRSGRHFSREHRGFHRPHVGAVVVLPLGAYPVAVDDSMYYYSHGVYYKGTPRGYVMVPAPIGAVVPELPDDHKTVVIDGITYHEYGGVYYKGGPAGYVVVPVYQGETASALAKATPGEAVSEHSIIVNVPNKNGSYMPVTLQRASNGTYIGPQGEVYPTLPDTRQLQSMYGK